MTGDAISTSTPALRILRPERVRAEAEPAAAAAPSADDSLVAPCGTTAAAMKPNSHTTVKNANRAPSPSQSRMAGSA